MRFGRPHAVALSIALVGIAAYLAVPKGHTKVAPQISERQLRAMELAAVHRLNLPRAFVRLEKDCMTGRCYLVSTPSTHVAAIMPGLLRAAGFQPVGRLISAEPVAMLKQDHWSTGSRDPLVIACRTEYASSGQPLGVCQDAGRVGPTLINVLVTPYHPCQKQTCADPRRTEVLVWSAAFPTNR